MGKIIIINALVWSAILILASYFFKENEYYDIFLGIWVVGFTLVNSFLSIRGKDQKKS